MKLFKSRFLILFLLTLVLFTGGGFFLGYSGLIYDFRKVQSTEIRLLVEKDFLFPEFFRLALETRLPIHFQIEIAQDPDSFLEKASHADILWARKDWLVKTELHFKDFKNHKPIHDLLVRTLSADFFDPEETSATLLPILWTLPVIRLKPGLKIKNTEELLSRPGEVLWPFWGLSDFFPEFSSPTKTEAASKTDWRLFPLSTESAETSSPETNWFPETKLRPLVICLAFVENERLPTSLKENLLAAWLEPRLLARLASESQMAVTIVQAEELLPPWQRASALRKVGLRHLLRP